MSYLAARMNTEVTVSGATGGTLRPELRMMGQASTDDGAPVPVSHSHAFPIGADSKLVF